MTDGNGTHAPFNASNELQGCLSLGDDLPGDPEAMGLTNDRLDSGPPPTMQREWGDEDGDR